MMNTNSLFYLYHYRNRESGKAYIGVTGDLERRKRKHAEGKSGSRYFNHAVNKYGIDHFDFSILAIFDEVNVANYHENAAITSFGTLSPTGYNLIGGAPCSKYHGAHSQETKEKMSLAGRGRTITKEQLEKMNNARLGKPGPNKGKTFSPEYRKKLSEAHNGKGPSLEVQEKINVIRRTPESRKKFIEAHKGKICSPEHREKISMANKGRKQKPRSIEACKKHSDALKGKPWSQARRDAANKNKEERLLWQL
jgi:group I intron endonuclease